MRNTRSGVFRLQVKKVLASPKFPMPPVHAQAALSTPSGPTTQLLRLPAFEWLFLACVLTIPIMLPFYPFHGSQVLLADLIGALSLLALGVAVLGGKERLLPIAAYLPLIVFVFARAASAVTSLDRRLSVAKLPGMLLIVALAVLSMHVSRREGGVRRLLRAWMVGAVVTVIAMAAGVFAFYAGFPKAPILGGFGSLPPGNYPRPLALFNGFNLACNFLSVTVVLLVAMLEAGWIRRRTFMYIIVASVLSAMMTLSPGIGGLFLGVAL
jgi:putative inorganic carbon (hco3(-)) transporter